MGARNPGPQPDRHPLPESRLQRRHRRSGRYPATRRRRHPSLLHDRGRQRRQNRLPRKAQTRLFQVPPLPMTDRAPLELPNWLDIASRNHPDKLALEFAAERWTYSELRQRVEATAATLARSMSEQPGRIGILSANRPGFVVA